MSTRHPTRTHGPSDETGEPTTRRQEHALPGALLVPIEAVRRDPTQVRRDWRANDGYRRLEELTKSIREFGVLQPLLVRRESAGYRVIAGGRRLVAAQRAGLAEIPVVVREDTDSDGARVRILQLIENVQRHDLTPLDEARAFQELIDVAGMTPPQIALRVRVSEQQVRDRLRILHDQVLCDAVERRQIAASVAREIAKLPDEAAATLRRRVADGARVQLADVQAVRRALAEAGVIHPRLSPRADRAQPPAQTDQAADAQEGAPGGRSVDGQGEDLPPSAEAAVLLRPLEPADVPAWLAPPVYRQGDRAVEAARRAVENDYRLYRASGLAAPASAVAPAPPPPGKATAGVAGHPHAAPATLTRSPEGGATLAALLRGLDQPQLERVLLFGIERGWTLAGLLYNVQTADP